ncbi:MAG: hydroxymethylglutaryl-CoA lyase [Peptococcaceae bacterium]|jgi:hydroxymethylglutaryl-CoA lyase|nr:hydroxymethylglutaryl-CoA lyase [Peptococcaceae bacterium]MDH7524263.1 hydroxymethylglutaryl-CoA lyase [Peptococcaceae bacterium]
MIKLPEQIEICDVTIRDGFQNLDIFIPTEAKLYLIEELSLAGFKKIEITSLSNPKRIPQFRDAEEILKQVERRPDVTYQVVTMNEVAVRRAIALKEKGFGPDKVVVMISTSQSHNLVNAGEKHADHWPKIKQWIRMVKESGMIFCGCIGTIFGCPIEGPVPLVRAWEFAERFFEMGVDEIEYGDTTGEGTPDRVFQFYQEIIRRLPDVKRHIAHFHESRGWALANCVAALQAGIARFEASMGGLGGQPASMVDRVPVIGTGESYTPSDLTGNVRAEDLVVLLDEMGIRTGIDIDRYLEIGRLLEKIVGRKLRSWTTSSGRIPKSPTPYLEKVKKRFAHVLNE